MLNYNHITLVGTIGKDAETKSFEDKTLIKFTMCVSRSFKKGDEWTNESQWFNVQMWAKNTTQARALTKGQTVLVDGQMLSSVYDNKDGVKSVYWYVQASTVQVQLQKKNSESESGVSESRAQKEGTEPASGKRKSTKDEIPF